LLFAGWLAKAVPVTVWTRGSVGWVHLALLVLGHLMFMVLEIFASLVDSVVDLRGLPVLVVLFPLFLVNLLLRFRGSGWCWFALACGERFASGNDGIAQVGLQRLVISSKLPSAVWEFNPFGGSLGN